MLHNWSKETDGNSATVRTILFYLKKVFMDYRILVEKLYRLNLSTRIINCIIDFLSNYPSGGQYPTGFLREQN